MKSVVKLEEFAMLVLSIWALYYLKAEWWYYPLLVLGPDISMLGYLGGNRTGALVYNLFHHKGVAIVVFIAGCLASDQVVQLTGIVLFGHSSMDRMFGYGLKRADGFKYTHLGMIGKK